MNDIFKYHIEHMSKKLSLSPLIVQKSPFIGITDIVLLMITNQYNRRIIMICNQLHHN